MEIKLGDCYNSRGNGEDRKKVMGYDSFQYIPLFDSLANLLMDKSIYDQIKTVRTETHSEVLNDFCDGCLFKGADKKWLACITIIFMHSEFECISIILMTMTHIGHTHQICVHLTACTGRHYMLY